MYRQLISTAVVLGAIALASHAISAHSLTNNRVKLIAETRLANPTVAINPTVITADTGLTPTIWTASHFRHSKLVTGKVWGALKWHAKQNALTAAVRNTSVSQASLGRVVLEGTRALMGLHNEPWTGASDLYSQTHRQPVLARARSGSVQL